MSFQFLFLHITIIFKKDRSQTLSHASVTMVLLNYRAIDVTFLVIALKKVIWNRFRQVKMSKNGGKWQSKENVSKGFSRISCASESQMLFSQSYLFSYLHVTNKLQFPD